MTLLMIVMTVMVMIIPIVIILVVKTIVKIVVAGDIFATIVVLTIDMTKLYE